MHNQLIYQLLNSAKPTLEWEVSAVQPINPFTGQPATYTGKYHHEYDNVMGLKGPRQEVKALQLYRNDTGELLEQVPSSYVVIPNALFCDYVESIAEANPQYKFMGYVEIECGRKVFAAFSRDEPTASIGGSPIYNYLLIKNSHDQTSSFITYVYEFELRCENGMIREVNSTKLLSVPHSGAALSIVRNMSFRISEYEEWLNKEMRRRANYQTVKVNEDAAAAFAASVCGHNPVEFYKLIDLYGVGQEEDAVSTRAYNKVQNVYRDVLTTFSERGSMTLSQLESGLTRYITHTDAYTSAGKPKGFERMLKAGSTPTGAHAMMISRAETFMENVLEHPSRLRRYEGLKNHLN